MYLAKSWRNTTSGRCLVVRVIPLRSSKYHSELLLFFFIICHWIWKLDISWNLKFEGGWYMIFNDHDTWICLYYKLNIHAVWLVLTYNLSEDRHIDEITTTCIFHHTKQINSMLPWACSVTDHTSDTLCYTLMCPFFFVLTTFWHHLWSTTQQRQLRIYLLNKPVHIGAVVH